MWSNRICEKFRAIWLCFFRYFSFVNYGISIVCAHLISFKEYSNTSSSVRFRCELNDRWMRRSHLTVAFVSCARLSTRFNAPERSSAIYATDENEKKNERKKHSIIDPITLQYLFRFLFRILIYANANVQAMRCVVFCWVDAQASRFVMQVSLNLLCVYGLERRCLIRSQIIGCMMGELADDSNENFPLKMQSNGQFGDCVMEVRRSLS